MAEIVWRTTGESRLAMVFLVGVLIASALLGAGPGYIAALSAFFVYNFYLVDPRFTFSIDSLEDTITVIVFLAAAMLTSHLAGRIRDESGRAKARAAMMSALFDATRDFAAASDEAVIRQQLVKRLATAAAGEAAVWDGLRMMTEPPGLDLTPEFVREVTVEGRRVEAAHPNTRSSGAWNMRPLQVGDTLLGASAWRSKRKVTQGADENAMMAILSDSGAAAIARAKLAAAKADIETRARTETLRNALLSSISHDVRTPLAAIMASASSIRRYGGGFDDATRVDLASTIEEEAARLDTFVGNLLSMTRLESGALVIQRIGFSVPEVVERVVGRRHVGDRNVKMIAAQDVVEGAGDPGLFEQVFGNVFENAMRYSPADRPISITTTLEDEKIVVRMLDEGPGVPVEEIPHIFEKFYRSPSMAQKPGTGLGLAIARGLVEGMGGSICARNREPDNTGLLVKIQLPVMR